jgi:hypothetical protein
MMARSLESIAEEAAAIEEFRQAAREAKAAQEAAHRAANRYAAAVKKLSEACTQGDPAEE